MGEYEGECEGERGRKLDPLLPLLPRSQQPERPSNRIHAVAALLRVQGPESMVRNGQAAQRDPNAPRAANQVVRGLPPNRPEILGHRDLGSGNGAINRLAGLFRRRIAPIQQWFHIVTPSGQPEKWTQTKRRFVEGQDVRIDKFSWLDLDDRETIRQSPVHQFIEAGISSARLIGYRSDDFDHDDYQMYNQDYDRRYGSSLQPTERGEDLTVGAAEPYDVQLASSSSSPGRGTKRKSLAGLPVGSKRQKKNIPPKLSKDQWIEREREFRDHLWSINHYYDTVPPDTIYIAQDCNGRNVLAVFPRGLEIAYGPEAAAQLIDDISHNIREYAHSQPPPAVHDVRHTHHRSWVQENPEFQGSQGRCGVYHWGVWPELGHQHDVVPTKDTLKGGTRSNTNDGSYAFAYRIDTMKSFGPLTKAIDLLFLIIDSKLRQAYRKAYRRLRSAAKILTTTDSPDDELFPLRAVLVNTHTEPHVDKDDWVGGWAWLAPFGTFTGGDLCIPQLGIRVPMPAGSIVGIRGRELIHFTDKWAGARYSVVHFFKQSIRRLSFDDDNAEPANVVDDYSYSQQTLCLGRDTGRADPTLCKPESQTPRPASRARRSLKHRKRYMSSKKKREEKVRKVMVTTQVEVCWILIPYFKKVLAKLITAYEE
ncbi:hypothetical protein GP486_002837 [Trichoglossum hirsutum]|uniref:Uncharacterized protein n=1 Tax=Trichoglossum hirsutum TaxID=265104 RepID=A0A9P8RRC5_9PEZI|nr:hypothetical protein GP486_002837 [Trichoglossum hirsutum]